MPVTDIHQTKFSQRLLTAETQNYKGFVVCKWESGQYCIRPCEASAKEMKSLIKKAATSCGVESIMSHHFQNELNQDNKVYCIHLYTEELEQVKVVIDMFWASAQ